MQPRYCALLFAFYALYAVNYDSISVSSYQKYSAIHGKDSLRSEEMAAEILCIPEKNTFTTCHDKSKAACVGVWGGNIRPCSKFSHPLFYVPVCVENSTSYIFTCGSISNLYLCVSSNKTDNSIRPCNDIHRRACLVKSELQNCTGHFQNELAPPDKDVTPADKIVTSDTSPHLTSVTASEEFSAPNEDFFFIICRNCSVKSGALVEEGAFEKPVTLAKRLFSEG